MISAIAIICNKIWKTGELPTPWNKSRIITLPKNDISRYVTTIVQSAYSAIKARWC